ncbi:hypothetical protein [Micromonospora siamensis]|uniref:DivIVA domain-containing protein n=1 Tax=Micromonospora siamensis TaxID=299152 RepID=A0A1C5I0J8_9ACTN|nr:hypothetical protein [Micromonospora siamensis]SCG51753.1 hypothetical protein GA0074704_2689 [Micromonospora siamensis]
MVLPFVVTLRGYDMRQVEGLFTEVDRALAGDSEVARAAARDALRSAGLRRRIRGYAPGEVDAAIAHRQEALSSLGGRLRPVPVRPAADTPAPFTVVVGGYDIRQVDDLLATADRALAADSAVARAAARDALRSADLRRGLRGYARRAVDEAVAERLRAL